MPKTLKITIGAVIVAITAAVAVAIIAIATSPDRPTAAPLLAPVTAAQKYAQNSVPNYTSFAFASGAAMGAPDFAIAGNITGASTLGDSICKQLRNGTTEIELVTRLTGAGSGQYRLTSSSAVSVVDSAKIFICSGGTHS